jgi:hypothetical protein
MTYRINDGVGGSQKADFTPAIKDHMFNIELRHNSVRYFNRDMQKVEVWPDDEHGQMILRRCWYSIQKIMPTNGGCIDFTYDKAKIEGYLFYDKGYRVSVIGEMQRHNYGLPRILTPFHLRSFVTSSETYKQVNKSIRMSKEQIKSWSRMIDSWGV